MLNQLHGRGNIAAAHARDRGPEEMADALNLLLAGLFLVFFKTRNFHRHLSGPSRWDYDLLLESQSTDTITCMDAIAERLESLGLPALHPIGEVAQRRTERCRSEKAVDPASMLRELLADKHDLITLLERAKGLAERLEDALTTALLDRWTMNTEHHIWSLLKAL